MKIVQMSSIFLINNTSVTLILSTELVALAVTSMYK